MVLRILRGTSGVLQDLAEANRGGVSSKEPQGPTTEGQGVRKDPPRAEREEKERTVKEEKPDELPVERAGPEAASSYIEESEEEEIVEEEVPVQPVRPVAPLPEPRGSLGRALGLNPTGKAASTS